MSATTISATRAQRLGLGRMLSVGLLALAAAAAVLPVAAQGAPGPSGGHGGHHMGRPGMGGEGLAMMGDPARIGRMADRMLDGLGATEAQRTQIRQLAQAAGADMKATRESSRGLREKGLQLLAAPTVDTAALETLRQQMLAQHDQTSKRMLKLTIDIANVLTPEQRAKLGERMKQRAEIMRDRMQRAPRHASEPKS